MSTIAKASAQLLLDAINRDNNLSDNPLTLNEIGMGLPLPVTVGNGTFNTYCTVYGLRGQGYYGKVTVNYTRYELEKMFLGLTPVLIDANLTPQKISDLLPLFNDQYGVSLMADDIVDDVLPVGTTDTLVDIVAKDTNWAWLGTIRVRFTQNIPYIVDEIPADTGLNAINPTITFVDKPRAEYVTYGYDWTDISPVLTAGDAITGSPITEAQMAAIESITTIKFTMATGADIGAGEISLAGAVWVGTQPTNEPDLAYVNALTLGADSNYAGTLYFHFNLTS